MKRVFNLIYYSPELNLITFWSSSGVKPPRKVLGAQNVKTGKVTIMFYIGEV